LPIPNWLPLISTVQVEKSGRPPKMPKMGVMMSFTREFTIDVKAAPMITPTARSRTLPRRTNFLNPSSMAVPLCPTVIVRLAAVSPYYCAPRGEYSRLR
jgi:hypothetical protein